jgi:NAD(P)-dependent dehydrogenase (short-subunit alcohol dehydrogenase family)
MVRYSRRTTAEQVSEGIDLSGRHALVTGANTGLGMETTRVLALRGAHVTMACRDLDKAGIMIPMERRTADGFEAHFGINHLAHFLFTNLLLDSLRAAGRARVVVLSSAAMGMATLTPALEDLNWEQRKFNGFRSYGDSKLMNLMFAREFNRRHGKSGIVANALHRA